MNDDNAVTLNRQLKQQENISISEFGDKRLQEPIKIERFSRMGQLHLQPIEYYQLKVSYTVVRRDSGKSIDEALSSEGILVKQARRIIRSQDFKGNDMSTVEDPALAMYYSEKASFYDWLYLISKESFNTLPFTMLEEHEAHLRAIFDKIAVKGDGQSCLYRPEYDQAAVRRNVRNAFLPKTDIVTKQDVIPWKSDSEIKIDNSGYVVKNGVKTTDFWDGSIRSERKPLRLKVRNICGDESVFDISGQKMI